MSNQSTKPTYLSNNPLGKDLFNGRSQEKISKTIFDLINEKALPNNVIGLEGKWGSGKSNVIRILNKTFVDKKTDYVFFTYDAWGHQEDLTRKTFLEELISHLDSNEKFKGDIDWKEELKRLLAKKSSKNTAKFPKIKFYWILFMSSFILFSFLKVIYNDFLAGKDLIDGTLFPFLKPFVSKYLLPIPIFLWGLNELRKEYLLFNDNDETKGLNFKQRLMQLLYVFSGSSLESEEFEHVLEEEPSVKRFKEYFKKITEDLKSEGLVIVFDNMDRLSNSNKVLSLWSSIHTFFAEGKIDNVWVIIPYDKQHLSQHFSKNIETGNYKVQSFIGKTFSTIFRISPPVLSDWKRFFYLKFEEAFHDIFEEEEIEFISSLYELVVDINMRKPRDIITFVNNLVSLYLQHENSIDIKYLALFALRSNEILNNPLVSISSKNFMNEERYLFNDEPELEQSLAAIVYNVDKEKSGEVLLKNNIQEQFIRYNEDTFNSIKLHTDFAVYFNNVFQRLILSNHKPETISAILESVQNVISPKILKEYWEKFSGDVRSKDDIHFQEIKQWHKSILLNTSEKNSKELADRITRSSKVKFDNVNKSKDSDGSDYFWTLFELLDYLKNNSIKVKPHIDKVTFTPGQFLYYIDDLHEKLKLKKSLYKDLKISVESKDLNTYLIEHPKAIFKTHSFLHVIKFLIKEDNKYSFQELRENFEKQLQEIGYTQVEEIERLFEILKVFSNKNKIKLLPKNTGINYLNNFRDEKEEVYFDIVANQIAHLTPNQTSFSTIFNNELKQKDNAEEIASRIQYFTDFGNLLKFVVNSEQNYPLIEEVIRILNNKSYGFTERIHIEWTFENIGVIERKIFPDNIEIFLKSFDGWSHHFDEKINEKNIFDLGTDIIDLANNKDYHKFDCIKHYYDTAIRVLRDASEENWLDNFDSDDSNFNYAFSTFLNNNLLDKSVTKGSEFMKAYESYLKKIAKRELPVPVGNLTWAKLQNGYLDNRKQKRIFNDFLDLLLDHTEINTDEIKFFSSGLFKFSSNLFSNKRKAEEFVRKVIIPSRNNENTFSYLFINHRDELVKVINSIDEYKQDLFDLFSFAKEKE